MPEVFFTNHWRGAGGQVMHNVESSSSSNFYMSTFRRAQMVRGVFSITPPLQKRTKVTLRIVHKKDLQQSGLLRVA